MSDIPGDIPVEDGHEKPIGFLTSDGCLEVRELPDGTRGYVETDLGQTTRWMRQSPDLYALYMAAVEELQERRGL